MIKRVLRMYVLKKALKNGFKIGRNSEIFGIPLLGSEPYLISIGNEVTVAANVNFITHDGATRVFRKDPKYKDVIKYGRITIHDNCFIGINSTILPGVSIGPNSVVAAGSIVNKDVPPNSIFAGNPAKFIASVESYAEKSLETMPHYNKDAYKSDKVSELLRIYPKPW